MCESISVGSMGRKCIAKFERPLTNERPISERMKMSYADRQPAFRATDLTFFIAVDLSI